MSAIQISPIAGRAPSGHGTPLPKAFVLMTEDTEEEHADFRKGISFSKKSVVSSESIF